MSHCVSVFLVNGTRASQCNWESMQNAPSPKSPLAAEPWTERFDLHSPICSLQKSLYPRAGHTEAQRGSGGTRAGRWWRQRSKRQRVPLARGGTCLETSAGPGEVGNGCSLSHWGGQGLASTHTELLVSVLWVGALSFYGPKGLDHLEGSKLQEALHSMVAKQTGSRCSSCSCQLCDLWHLA